MSPTELSALLYAVPIGVVLGLLLGRLAVALDWRQARADHRHSERLRRDARARQWAATREHVRELVNQWARDRQKQAEARARGRRLLALVLPAGDSPARARGHIYKDGPHGCAECGWPREEHD